MKKIVFVILLLGASINTQAQYNIVYFSSEEFPFQLFINGDEYTNGYEYECMLKDIDNGLYKCDFKFQFDLYNFTYLLKAKANTYKYYHVIKTELSAIDKKFKSLNETISKDLNLKEEEEAEANKEALKYMDFKLEIELVEENPMTFVDMDAFNELRVEVTTKPNLLPGYNGPVGCTIPMTNIQLIQAKHIINEKETDETKKIIAKQIIETNCFFVYQLVEIISLFQDDSSKLELAKIAYYKVYDIGNYYQLNNLFESEESIKELDQYINSIQ